MSARGGTADRGHPPPLEAWKVLRREPSERRPWAWDMADARRIARLDWVAMADTQTARFHQNTHRRRDYASHQPSRFRHDTS